MTLLIADDEELIRFTIKDMIKECALAFDRILEADSGKSMISLCRKEKPDIALVDIRMPGKTGLEAMEELSDLSMQWIILTGHADFEYARKALRLGADEYLLKPPSPEEISKVLNSAIQRIELKRKEKNEDFERRVLSIFNNTSSPAYDSLFSENGKWSGEIFCLDGSLPQNEAMQVRTDFAQKLRKKCLYSASESRRSALVTMDDGKLLLLSFYALKNAAYTDLSNAISLSVRKGLRISRISRIEADSFKDFLSELDAWKNCLPLRFFLNEEEMSNCPEDIKDLYLDFCRKTEELLEMAGLSRKEESDSLIRELLDMKLDLSPDRDSYLRSFLSDVFPALNQGSSVNEMLRELIGEEKKGEDQSILVQQALRIIRERYGEDIGLAQIADILQVTPNYLSSLFRKHSGTPFTRYITEIRLNRARTLLKDSSLNVKEIATEVGYHSSRHFAALFRQENGMSPSDFIKRYRS